MGTEAVAGNPESIEGAQTKLIHVTPDLHTRLRVEAAHNGTTLRALTEEIIGAWFEAKKKSGSGEA